MKKQIIEFYEKKKVQIPDMINKRPTELLPTQVEEAAEIMYHQIKNGLKIKDISIARRVFQIAGQVNGKKYADENVILENSKKIIADIEYTKDLMISNRDFWKIKHETILEQLKEMNAKYQSLLKNSKKITADLKHTKGKIIHDRDFWKTKHELLIKELIETKENIQRLILKNNRLKFWLISSYTALIWGWNIYKVWCIYEIILF